MPSAAMKVKRKSTIKALCEWVSVAMPESWMVVVTGASGRTGSLVVKKLVERGSEFEPVGL
eukprot:scaffold222560_cov48-Prasinocladus_malaysianus.AAC.1